MAMSTDPRKAPSILRKPTRLAPLSTIAMFIWVWGKKWMGKDGLGWEDIAISWVWASQILWRQLGYIDYRKTAVVYLDIKLFTLFDGNLAKVCMHGLILSTQGRNRKAGAVDLDISKSSNSTDLYFWYLFDMSTYKYKRHKRAIRYLDTKLLRFFDGSC